VCGPSVGGCGDNSHGTVSPVLDSQLSIRASNLCLYSNQSSVVAREVRSDLGLTASQLAANRLVQHAELAITPDHTTTRATSTLFMILVQEFYAEFSL